jgi:hypothetical protein
MYKYLVGKGADLSRLLATVVFPAPSAPTRATVNTPPRGFFLFHLGFCAEEDVFVISQAILLSSALFNLFAQVQMDLKATFLQSLGQIIAVIPDVTRLAEQALSLLAGGDGRIFKGLLIQADRYTYESPATWPQ